jgi:hypothetical protein
MMNARSNDAEEAAAQAVARVLGAEYEINDTGAEPGQYDVKLTTDGGVVVALEVTSFGGDNWKQTRARIAKQRQRGTHAGRGLKNRWLVVVPTGTSIRDLQPRLDEQLGTLEATGHTTLSIPYDGANRTLATVAKALADLKVNSVNTWGEPPPDDEPRVLLVQSERVIGTAGALPAAVAAVLQKDDNQKKLAKAECDQRHLYVFMENRGAGAVLEGAWPLPECPADPAKVIDVVWVYSPSDSAYLFRVPPGTADWKRFTAATGEEATPA